MSETKIPFNKPYLSGKELYYISQTILNAKTSGNQDFTKKCHKIFSHKYSFKRCLLTTSCTDALEMASILANIQPGDEVILPSYTFVSTANAFVLRGAKLIFADTYDNNPNIDPEGLEELITSKTKAIVIVHYAGVACDMDALCHLCKKYGLILIEDAAQAIDSFYKGRALGSFGEYAAFSFHETKNLICGEGGLFVCNTDKDILRSEIIWEKGTNRSAFFRGEVDKYGWVDIGSSFLASDILAAFLYAQLENMESIQKTRIDKWNKYHERLKPLEEKRFISLPYIPDYATNNGHMFYIVCRSLNERTQLIKHLRKTGIHAVFHYLSLHKSTFYHDKHDGRNLPNTDRFADCLVRLPLFVELSISDQEEIINQIEKFYI